MEDMGGGLGQLERDDEGDGDGREDKKKDKGFGGAEGESHCLERENFSIVGSKLLTMEMSSVRLRRE